MSVLHVKTNNKHQIHIIDPEDEYLSLAKALYGQEIMIEKDSHEYINPMKIDPDETNPKYKNEK